MMNTVLQNILRIVPLSVLAAAMVATALSGCGVTGPDESVWQHAADFSWRFTSGMTVLFRHDEYLQDPINATSTVVTLGVDTVSDIEYRSGVRMTTMHRGAPRVVNMHFLTAGDTVSIFGPLPFKHAALTSPLVVGREWAAGMIDSDTSWRATITARLAYRKVDTIVYANVIEVEYWPTAIADEHWRCYFAAGIGLVDAIKLKGGGGPEHGDFDSWTERWMLLGTGAP